MKVIDVISDTPKVGEGGSEFRVILDEELNPVIFIGAYEAVYPMVSIGDNVINIMQRDDTADGEIGWSADSYWVYVCRLRSSGYCDANDLLGKELVVLVDKIHGPLEQIMDSQMHVEMPGELTLDDLKGMLSGIYFSRSAIKDRVEAPVIRVVHDEEEGTILVEIKGTFSVMTGIGGLKRYLENGVYSKIFYNDMEIKDADMNRFKRWVNGEQ